MQDVSQVPQLPKQVGWGTWLARCVSSTWTRSRCSLRRRRASPSWRDSWASTEGFCSDLRIGQTNGQANDWLIGFWVNFLQWPLVSFTNPLLKWGGEPVCQRFCSKNELLTAFENSVKLSFPSLSVSVFFSHVATLVFFFNSFFSLFTLVDCHWRKYTWCKLYVSPTFFIPKRFCRSLQAIQASWKST